jgi:hypothetical protein
MHVREIVHKEQHAGITEYVGVRGEGGEDGKHLAPGHLTGGGMEVRVLRRIDAHEARPDTQLGGPLRNIGGGRGGLEVITEAPKASVGREDERGRPGGTPALFPVPPAEVAKPEVDVGAEAAIYADARMGPSELVSACAATPLRNRSQACFEHGL